MAAANASEQSTEFLSATQLRELAATGATSVATIAEETLARVARVNPTLNAFRSVDSEDVRRQAATLDNKRRRGEPLGSLFGVPIAVKEHIAVAGLPVLSATAGNPADGKLLIASEDSIVVERLRAADALIVGTTIMPGMGTGSTMTDLADHPRNPYDLERVPGSSSAGSAAAVAAGLVPVAIGSDGGGSTRLPAALCGVVGMHPTVGRVPSVNYANPGVMLTSTYGPITRDARDAALVLQAIAGPDGRDPLSIVHSAAPDYAAQLGEDVTGMRLAWTDDFGFARQHFIRNSEKVVPAIREAANAVSGLGAMLETPEIELEDSWPHILVTGPAYQGNHFRGETGDEAKLREALAVLARNRARMDSVFLQHDFVLSPTIPFTAPTVEEWDRYWKDSWNQIGFTKHYTCETFMFNWIALPAISVPIGLIDGMPVGMQIVGPPDSEPAMLRLAHAFLAANPYIGQPSTHV